VEHETAAFVIDRQARGVSPRTVEFYADELRYLRDFLETQQVTTVERITPTIVRQYLLHLAARRFLRGGHSWVADGVLCSTTVEEVLVTSQ